jgi:hypothetical protein
MSVMNVFEKNEPVRSFSFRFARPGIFSDAEPRHSWTEVRNLRVHLLRHVWVRSRLQRRRRVVTFRHRHRVPALEHTKNSINKDSLKIGNNELSEAIKKGLS